MKIKMKIVIPMAVLTLFVAAMILASNIIQFTNYIDTFMKDRISSASEVASSELVRLKSGSNTASLYISSDSVIIEALMTGDRDALMYRAKQMRADTNVEFCTIMDADGIVLVRPHEPEKFGDSLASQANVRAAMSGNSLTAIEQGTAVRLSVRSGAPIYDTQGRLIGVVSTGYRLDTDTFVDSIKALMNCEVAVFLGDEQISTTVLKDDGTRAVGTKAPEDISKTVLIGNTYSGTAQLFDRDANTKYSPIYGTDGKVLGMLLVGRYTTEESKMTWSFILVGLLITLILLAVSIPAILFIAGRIAAPLNAMVVAADALAVGDTEISVTVNTRDETRDLADAFNKMTNNIRRQVEIISAIASGDISVAVEERSDKDVMNHALKAMLFNNNSVFSEIISSAQQVSLGSRQVADGSQSLAQGTAEQAAAVEQLSCFISEIAGKTRENENLAVRTAALACKIKDNAERGNRQMGEMMAAVREINHASNSISKVIKVIDDIAFQTNILALNAAVEAARAGQHGKGFAVVAEEVRNLAAKSAEAAKNTAELIANSVEKAELGARIADETAASLMEIVAGITESNRLVGEIASSSAVQSVGISQINKGIEQVAHVIQQNSATAEESAAASEEMNCQAKILEDLMSQFKLANNGMYSVKSLPSHQIKQGKALFTSADENRLSGNH